MKPIKNKKGFTLVELLVVLVILAILGATVIPSMMGYIDKSKELLCKVNRSTIIRGWTYSKYYLPDQTLAEYFNSNDDYKDGAVCPSGGTYNVNVEKNTVECSIHTGDGVGGGGETGGDNPGGGMAPGDIPIKGNGWPTEDMFDAAGNYHFSAGEVFEYGGSYYIVTVDWDVYKSNAVNGPDAILSWDKFEKITGKTWDSTSAVNGYIEHIVCGDIYTDETGKYIFTPNQGGWGRVPPADNMFMWYKVS